MALDTMSQRFVTLHDGAAAATSPLLPPAKIRISPLLPQRKRRGEDSLLVSPLSKLEVPSPFPSHCDGGGKATAGSRWGGEETIEASS
jgi:hypothetical protein